MDSHFDVYSAYYTHSVYYKYAQTARKIPSQHHLKYSAESVCHPPGYVCESMCVCVKLLWFKHAERWKKKPTTTKTETKKSKRAMLNNFKWHQFNKFYKVFVFSMNLEISWARGHSPIILCCSFISAFVPTFFLCYNFWSNGRTE